MLRSWLMAESVSPRFAECLGIVPVDLRRRMQAGLWETLTDTEWQYAEHWIREHRSGFLESLLR